MTSRAGLVSITKGMSNALTKDQKMVRACSACDMKMPRYPGRYPGKCPRCGECVEMVEGWSRIPRINRLLDSGEHVICEADGGEGEVVSLSYDLIEDCLSAGLVELGYFTEQSDQKNIRYREESKDGPVLIFEFMDDERKCLVYLAERDTSMLGFDSKETRNSAFRSPKIGTGAKRIVGGFRFQIGKNRRRKPHKDIEMAMRNRRNARRGLAKRVKAAKNWHQSYMGRRYHQALGRYNSGSHTESEIITVTRDRLRARLKKYRAGDIVEAYQPQNVYNAAPPTIDDIFDEIMRKLIFAESVDVLEDVNFGEDGSIYLFFDPQLSRQEIDIIVSAIKTGEGDAILIASPDRSLPQESAKSDWWVAYLPGEMKENGFAAPDERKYARTWNKSAKPTKQIIQKSATDVGRMSMSIDTKSLFRNLGERKMHDDAKRWLNL